MAFQLNVSKRVTKERDIKKRDDLILQLTMKGWNSKEIGQHPELNYAIHNSQCQRVIQIQNELVEQGRLKKNEHGGFDIPVAKIAEHKWNKIEADLARSNVPAFQTLVKYLTENGRATDGIINITNGLTVLCNTLDIHPNEILNATTIDGEPNYLQKARDCLMEMQKHMNAGTIKSLHESFGKRRDGATVVYYRSALRMLLLSHNKTIPKLPKTDILSGTKGDLFGAYNSIGLTDKQHADCIAFIEKNGKDILGKNWDYGYVGIVTLMPEMITRTESLALWKVNYVTEYEEYERQPVQYDFVKGFFESKTAKSQPQGWDKFIIEPHARKTLAQLMEYRKGKTIVEFNDSKVNGVQVVTKNVNTLMREYYIDAGILPQEARKKYNERSESGKFKKGSEQHFFDTMSAYVLRHSGAHRWCRRTKYDYGFVAELGWTDMNTLRECYAGMDIRARMKQNDCFYCNPPMNPDAMANKIFCSATHAFIYYSNGQKPKVKN